MYFIMKLQVAFLITSVVLAFVDDLCVPEFAESPRTAKSFTKLLSSQIQVDVLYYDIPGGFSNYVCRT
jgi:hypothetical protein